MPLTTTHALVPLAGALAFPRKPLPWRLVVAAMVAAAVPDLDAFVYPIWHLPASSIYTHRGVAHSLFAAVVVGLIAARFHQQLKVRPAVAGLVVGAAMASHGLLDMMTDYGLPVAYLWPLSTDRYFALWRPIHSGELEWGHWAAQLPPRLYSELWHLIVPMFAVALAARIGRRVLGRLSSG
jgi:inner membrane protein